MARKDRNGKGRGAAGAAAEAARRREAQARRAAEEAGRADEADRHRAEVEEEEELFGPGYSFFSDPDLEDLRDQAKDFLVAAVAATLEAADAAAVEPFVASFDHIVGDDEEGNGRDMVVTSVAAMAMDWLLGARNEGIDGTAAVFWVKDTLGDRAFRAALALSELTGYSRAPHLSMQAVEDTLEAERIPALVYLAAGVAATAGGGEAEWLRQFGRAEED